MRLKVLIVVCTLAVSCLSLGFIGKHDTLSGYIETETQKGTVFTIPLDDDGDQRFPRVWMKSQSILRLKSGHSIHFHPRMAE